MHLIKFQNRIIEKMERKVIQRGIVKNFSEDYRTVLWTLWERERVGRFGRMALKHVKYHV